MPSQPEACITKVTVVPKSGQVLLQVSCPTCLRHHLHGGGTDINRARRFLGHRVSGCTDEALRKATPKGQPLLKRGDYVLVDPDGLIP